jgi:hypothetical protein
MVHHECVAEMSRARIFLRVLADAIAIAVATFLLAGALWTVGNLNPGVYPSTEGRYRHGTADVQECHRVGPVSLYGFGYWWRCEAEMTFADGGLVTVTVGHSIVSPDDIGRLVPFLEHCEGKDYEDCRYGKPGRPLLAAGASLLQLLAVIVALAGVWLSAVAAYNALLGRRRWGKATFSRRS